MKNILVQEFVAPIMLLVFRAFFIISTISAGYWLSSIVVDFLSKIPWVLFFWKISFGL
jgi:hypothetical protein